MATRLKTVEFAFDSIGSVTNNTLTTFGQITVYLPEAPSGAAFKKVVVHLFADDASTTPGNVSSRAIGARVGAAGYTTVTKSDLYTGSGESIALFDAADFTSHFQTNWSGTSMTMDVQCTINGTGTGAAWRNVNAIVYITYEYDDTSSTQIKTVYIPLNMPVGVLATSKPGSALDTIPNLSTELPEASKSFRSSFIVVQGNMNNSGLSTTDRNLNFQLDTTTARATGTYELGQTSDRWFRYVWDISGVLNTGSTMGWYAWSSGGNGWNHLQAYLVVTYEFDATSNNDIFVSVLLPMELTSPMGGTTSSDHQRATREFFIEEPGTITTKQLAFYAFWDVGAAISGLNMRIGTGSFVTYTDGGGMSSGGHGAMVRNDAAFTLARGRNSLNFDIYRTDATDLGYNVSGFFIVNYTASKPTQGYGAANHTVRWNLGMTFNGAAAVERVTEAVAPSIPESSYFITAVGTNFQFISNSTQAPTAFSVLVERLASGEGGMMWESAYIDFTYTDAESGLRQAWSQVRTLFKRWPGDADGDRMDIETARRWKAAMSNNCASFQYLDLLFTYHTISFPVSGNISGSGSGTVTIDLHRAISGEKVLTTSRSGDGAFSFDWYDNTEQVFVSAREDDTHLGRSNSATAG